VHIQRLLREPPHGAVGSIIDKEIEPVVATASLETVTRTLATYNLVSLPVVDDDGRLIGAVTVDDVLDHILPEDWREERHAIRARPGPHVRPAGAALGRCAATSSTSRRSSARGCCRRCRSRRRPS